MNIIKRITTEEDRKYFETEQKILDAHYRGKLGRDWYTLNPKNGKLELKPKNLYDRIK